MYPYPVLPYPHPHLSLSTYPLLTYPPLPYPHYPNLLSYPTLSSPPILSSPLLSGGHGDRCDLAGRVLVRPNGTYGRGGADPLVRQLLLHLRQGHGEADAAGLLHRVLPSRRSRTVQERSACRRYLTPCTLTAHPLHTHCTLTTHTPHTHCTLTAHPLHTHNTLDTEYRCILDAI